MSTITTIYDSIAALTPTYDSDVTIGVRNYDNNKDILKDFSMPVRVLTVLDDAQQPTEFSHIALGTTQGVEWFILDTLYLGSVQAHPIGLAGYSLQIVNYTASYLEQIRLNRSPSTCSTIRGARIIPRIRNWPNFEGQPAYYAIDAIINVFEVIT